MSGEGPMEDMDMIKKLLGGVVDTSMQKLYDHLTPENAKIAANYYATFYNVLKEKTDMPDMVIFLLAVEHNMDIEELAEVLKESSQEGTTGALEQDP